MVIVSLALLLPLMGATTSEVPDPDLSTATIAGAGCVTISPWGDEASLGDLGLTVTVSLRDSQDQPIINYPFQDLTLASVDGAVSICPGGLLADGNTNVDGQATLSSAIAGGGFSDAGAQVVVGGTPLNGPPLPLTFASPDLDGDLRITITDVAPFAEDYSNGVYDAVSDFNCDGVEDLFDVGIMASRNGQNCQ